MSGRARPLLAFGAALLALLALGADRLGGEGGLPNLEAIPAVARTLAAAVVLFGVVGVAVTPLVLPPRLRQDAALLVLPVGAVFAGLALTVLGFTGAPFELSLPLLLGGAAVIAVVLARRGRLRVLIPAADARGNALAALAAGVIIVAVALVPMLRDDSFATVFGQNGDAHLATGAATLLQHAGPTEVADELPVDRMPGAWKSKYPIYYVFAAVSDLAGLDPVETFMALSALMLALTGLGFWLMARHMLGAGVAAAATAMVLVGLGEQALTLVHSPFYNQLWGSFALPYTLLGSWLYLREPSRAALGLAAPFFIVGFLAYPLLAPFTAAFVAICGALVLQRHRRAGESPGWVASLRLPRGRGWTAVWIAGGAFGLLFALAATAAGTEKIVDGIAAALPGGDLAPWSGEALGFLRLDRALSVSRASVLAPVMLGLAAFALTRVDREVAIPLATTVGALLLAAAYLRLRDGGQLFVFKALSFAGLVVVATATVGAFRLLGARQRWLQWGAALAIAAITIATASGARLEARSTTPHVTKDLAEIADWGDRLPAGASVRVDVAGYGRQQWAWYMLAEHPVSSLSPLLDFFPHAPVGRKADYLLVDNERRAPADASGAPVFSNGSFALYRMRPGVPGPDVSSRRMIDPFVGEDAARPGARELPG